MVLFWVVGLVGVAVLLVTLLLDDVLEVPDLVGGVLSGVVLGGAATAYGIAGATATAAGAGLPVAAGAGLLAGLALGGVALVLTRAMTGMATDRALTTADLVGVDGVVVTHVRAGRFGEVALRVGGHPLKLNATAEADLPAGSPVFVVETLSPTAVRVLPF